VTGQWFVAAALAALGGAALDSSLQLPPRPRLHRGWREPLHRLRHVDSNRDIHLLRIRGTRPPWAWAIPLVVLAVPLYDTASVVITRLRNRRPIFEGDRNHVAHRLLALGMAPRAAVLTVYAMTAMTASRPSSSSR